MNVNSRRNKGFGILDALIGITIVAVVSIGLTKANLVMINNSSEQYNYFRDYIEVENMHTITKAIAPQLARGAQLDSGNTVVYESNDLLSTRGFYKVNGTGNTVYRVYHLFDLVEQTIPDPTNPNEKNLDNKVVPYHQLDESTAKLNIGTGELEYSEFDHPINYYSRISTSKVRIELSQGARPGNVNINTKAYHTSKGKRDYKEVRHIDKTLEVEPEDTPEDTPKDTTKETFVRFINPEPDENLEGRHFVYNYYLPEEDMLEYTKDELEAGEHIPGFDTHDVKQFDRLLYYSKSDAKAVVKDIEFESEVSHE